VLYKRRAIVEVARRYNRLDPITNMNTPAASSTTSSDGGGGGGGSSPGSAGVMARKPASSGNLYTRDTEFPNPYDGSSIDDGGDDETNPFLPPLSSSAGQGQAAAADRNGKKLAASQLSTGGVGGGGGGRSTPIATITAANAPSPTLVSPPRVHTRQKAH